MAINLEKAPLETLYYYADNGKTVGPFPLNELLQKIKADTLVYRDGIEWTNAKDVEELRGYFPEKEPKKPAKLILVSILLCVLLGAGALIIYQMIKPEIETTGGAAGTTGPSVTSGPSETSGTSGTTVTPETNKPTDKEVSGSTNTPRTNGNSASSDLPKTDQSKEITIPSGKTSRVKQEDLFTCTNGKSILRTQVNDGICDCEDDPCSDETKN